MRTLNFEQMAELEGGSGACSNTLFFVGLGISALGFMASGGAAGVVIFAYGAYIGGIGQFLCPY